MSTPVSANPYSSDVRADVVQRVATSAAFQRSPRLRELLLYICDRALRNRPEDLREQLIGCSVFGRKPDYNPGEDNIVRVEVRQLRKRLEEYFATEGKAESHVILIPKGSYVPVFEPRESAEIKGEPPVSVDAPARKTLPRWLFWTQAAVIAILAVVCLWMAPNRAAHGRLEAERTPLWPLLFNEDSETAIVCADSGIVATQSLTERTLTLDAYLAKDYSGGRTDLSPDAAAILRRFPGWHFTDMADLRLILRLYRLNAEHWQKTTIRSARDMQIQDFKDGNTVILGSAQSNLWNTLFEPIMKFQIMADQEKHRAYIRNKTPLPGEQAVYDAKESKGGGSAYGVVALIPNLRRSGYVLIIAGTAGDSTDASGEFITSSKVCGRLINDLMKQHNGRLPYFEVLLKSGSLGGVASAAEVVSVHILPDDVQPGLAKQDL